MCLYPKLIPNPKYKPNKKNGGFPPICEDERLAYIPAACGICLECREQKARAWRVRLAEELRENPRAKFVTLTIDEYNLTKYKKLYKDENDIATKILRLFLERVRAKYKKSVKHWVVTELGEERGRIHLHGIFFTDNEEIFKHWTEGNVFIGGYVNERTVNYIVKYMVKPDIKNKFTGVVLCSKGIGAHYVRRTDAALNKFNGTQTKETYRFRNGVKINLPIYYRNKIYTEEEKEKLFLQKIEKGEIYVRGVKVRREDEEEYLKLLENARQLQQRLYGVSQSDWEEAKYLQRLRKQGYSEKECTNALEKYKKHREIFGY